MGVVSGAFLLNMGAGVFFEIPDNIPVIGNLDEAAATALLLSVLSYFGLDLTRLFRKMGGATKAGNGNKGDVIEAETVPVEKKEGE